MTTQLQQAASRSNGARSRGAVTPEGRRRSPRNAIRHGLLSNATVLQNESRRGFQAMLRKHVESIGPRDAVEQSAVEEICSASWRIRRLWLMERKALDLELDNLSSPDEPACLIQAFESMASNHPHTLLFHRYETRLHNIIQRALARITSRRRDGIPNEPGHLDENKRKSQK